MRSTKDLLTRSNGHRPRPFPGPDPATASAPTPLPVPDDACPKCRGAQWLRLDVPIGHRQFGTLVPCDCLSDHQAEQRVRDSRRLSQLEGLSDRTFDSFDETVDGIRPHFETAKAYAEEPDGWLVMSGRCGSGKTHLAVAIANARLAAGEVSVIFAVVPDLLDHLRATFDPSRGVDYDKRFDEIRNANVLVLDDLGTENATPWAREKLFQIINHRYNGRMPTVITTNRPFSEIDERIVSRMMDRSFSRSLVFDRVEDFRQRGQPGYVRGRTYRPYR